MILPDLSTIVPQPFEWCMIPEGQVILQYNTQYLRDFVDHEDTFSVSPFGIARFPITNAQYQVFLNADDGYKNAALWNFSIKAQHWRARVTAPPEYQASSDDEPRTHVTWLEAIAFCRWLTSHVNTLFSERSESHYEFTLPTEQQWERAVGGDFGIVCLPPKVYEWCLTAWEGSHTDLNTRNIPRVVKAVLQGSAANSPKSFTRAHAIPLEHHHIGFRVVCNVV